MNQKNERAVHGNEFSLDGFFLPMADGNVEPLLLSCSLIGKEGAQLSLLQQFH